MSASLYLGIMSGTSLDGIDIALVDFSSTMPRVISSHCYAIPQSLRQQLLTLCENQQTTLQNLGEIDHQLGLLYANSINQFLQDNQIESQKIQAIGCHGQTIFHAPNSQYPFTMQIGDSNLIAAKTAITTIADFRRKDMAYGGQGAPLVPAFHKEIFSDQSKNRVILNIGGIANITVLIPNQPVIGYDTGPGNVLLDSWINHNTGKNYDLNAQWAKTGTVERDLLQHLLNEPYFQLSAPKSTGRELFNLNWLQHKLSGNSYLPENIQATLVDFTVVSIINELHKLNTSGTCELIICGGGAKNPLMMQRFQQLLPDWIVTTTNAYGIDGDYMEAVAFAWLAYQRIHDLPGNIPEVTGASKAISLGVIYPKS